MDVLLWKDVCLHVQNELGVIVELRQANLVLPAPDREPLKDYLAALRKQLLKDGLAEFQNTLKQLREHDAKAPKLCDKCSKAVRHVTSKNHAES